MIHTERYAVPAETMAACAAADRVVAVGTTVVRALESAAATGALAGRTDLYIHGRFPFRVVDVLVTNFHLPRSTLLLLVESFYGPGWRDLYAEALARRVPLPLLRRRHGRRPGRRRGRLNRVRAVRFEPIASDGTARTGVVRTARGSYAVPTFMPVGTRGAVKALDSRRPRGARRRGGAGQHLPPHAAPRCPDRGRPRRAAPLQRLVGGTP